MMGAPKFPQYKTVPTASLIPYARNARTHSPAQVDKIAASIREFGFLSPIITDGQSGIVAGHGRVMAAQKLGLDTLPTIDAAHLTEAQRRANGTGAHSGGARQAGNDLCGKEGRAARKGAGGQTRRRKGHAGIAGLPDSGAGAGAGVLRKDRRKARTFRREHARGD